jgi:hypothetical protein
MMLSTEETMGKVLLYARLSLSPVDLRLVRLAVQALVQLLALGPPLELS